MFDTLYCIFTTKNSSQSTELSFFYCNFAAEINNIMTLLLWKTIDQELWTNGVGKKIVYECRSKLFDRNI